MKTTLEIPDAVFRRAKAVAAERGISLRALVPEALAGALRAESSSREGRPGMKGFGALRDLRKETARINRIIEDEFERIGDEDPA
jgi:hypothetical protein